MFFNLINLTAYIYNDYIFFDLFLFFSSRFLKWDGKKYNEIIIDGKTLKFDGKSILFQKIILKYGLFFIQGLEL